MNRSEAEVNEVEGSFEAAKSDLKKNDFEMNILGSERSLDYAPLRSG